MMIYFYNSKRAKKHRSSKMQWNSRKWNTMILLLLQYMYIVYLQAPISDKSEHLTMAGAVSGIGILKPPLGDPDPGRWEGPIRIVKLRY